MDAIINLVRENLINFFNFLIRWLSGELMDLH
jgi:hypothetical protein